MKKKVLAMLLALTMVSGVVSGCGKTDTNNSTEKKATETAKEDSTEKADSTEADATETTSKYGVKSDAGQYVDSDTVGEDTLKKAGWVKLSSNGLSFYAPKECNTYAKDNSNSSLCIVGLNEDLYDKGDENTVIYGATDLYAVCKIDASGTFKSNKEKAKDEKSTETEDNRVAIKNGVFTKGETEDLIKTVLNDNEVKTKVFLDNDEMIIYQLDGCSAYLGFIYGTTDLIEIIFDPAAYKDIYEIKAQIGKVPATDTENKESTENTESTENKEATTPKLATIKGKTGYLSEQYLEQYKSANEKGKVGKVAYKAGYFIDGEKEAALIKTIARVSKEEANK